MLVFNERLYPRDLPPSVAGGGTVDYVSPIDQDFIADVEEREKAGTPGVLQTLKAALALDLKRRIGATRIDAREQTVVGHDDGRPVRHAGGDLRREFDRTRFAVVAALDIAALQP